MPGTIRETPKYGQRVSISVIDEFARVESEREWISIPCSSDPVDGWKPITFKEASRAIDRATHDLIARFGHALPAAFPTIAYIGLNDSRYFIFMYACVKAGYKALFISPRNSSEGQGQLFDQTNCHRIAYAPEFESSVQSWTANRPMKSWEVAPEQYYYEEGEVSHIPYEKPFETAQWDPLVVLHTSGSSGFPKPIICRHGLLAVADAYRNLPEKYGSRPWIPAMADRMKRILLPMPLFHAAGCYTTIYFSVYYGIPVNLAIASKPMTADVVYDSLRYSSAEATQLPPSILEDMSKVQTHVQVLKTLEFVSFGGGTLAPHIGDQLKEQGVKLFNVVASTEGGPYPLYYQTNYDLWQYFILNAEMGGIEWREVPGQKDVYRHVFVRKDQNPGYQGIFYTFPDSNEFDTNDLFRRHPHLTDHWMYYGRSDSIIVFSNGEKLNPVDVEATVSTHPQLKGTLVVGANRFEPALLLEPVHPPRDEREGGNLLESVWPLVNKANRETVAHGRIGYDMIMLTDSSKPFPRAGKGTIQRPMAVKLYEREIDLLYEGARRDQCGDAFLLDVSSREGLVESVRRLFITKIYAPDIGPDTDYFTAGIDSLQVIAACRMLSAALRAVGVELGSPLSPRIVYNNPTHRRLATHLHQLAQPDGVKGHTNGSPGPSGMEAMIKKYTRNLPVPDPHKPSSAYDSQTVLLTGSTGALGCHLLDAMVRNPNITKIICLNRSADGPARQTHSSSTRGLPTAFAKCDFLHADLSLPGLGLPHDAYARLLASVDHVIHNQWPVNFNLALPSFEPHVRGVRHLVDLAASAARRPAAITFVSSIGTLDLWPGPGPVPEAPVRDVHLSSTGYGQSKHASSLVLDAAAAQSGVPTTVIRVGQIAGPRDDDDTTTTASTCGGGGGGGGGAWNRHEWLPSIIASSAYLGVLPGSLGKMDMVDWVPIEDVARVVLEVAGVVSGTVPMQLEAVGGLEKKEEEEEEEEEEGDARARSSRSSSRSSSSSSRYFHCVNPATTTWAQLVPAVREHFGTRVSRVVPWGQWVDELRASAGSASTAADVSLNPGLKLLDMYEGLRRPAAGGGGEEGGEEEEILRDGNGNGQVFFDMRVTQESSAAARGLEAITPELMTKWCRQWGF